MTSVLNKLEVELRLLVSSRDLVEKQGTVGSATGREHPKITS